MKHVFYAHSHTIFLTALGAVEYLKLNPEDVIFIYTRNYINNSVKIPYKEIDLSVIFSESMKRGEEFYFWKLNKLVKNIDDIISKEISGDYLAYLPHVGVFLPQVVATNSYCKGIRFVEEGIHCYSSSIGVDKKTSRERVKRLFSLIFTGFNRFWFTDQVFFHDFLFKKLIYPTETFGLSNETFKKLEFTKNIVEWPIIKTQTNIDSSLPIFIFEAAIEQKFVGKRLYMIAVKKIVNFTDSEIIYVKFHPAQNEENKNTIRQYFADQNKKIIDLPQDVAFELMMAEYSNLHVIGFGSSLLLYAKKLGHQVFSYENLLLEDALYIKYKKKVDFKI